MTVKCNWQLSKSCKQKCFNLKIKCKCLQRMKFLFCLFMFVLMFCDAVNHTNNPTVNNNNTKPKMLQIGIKKRIENCSAKSKKGDLLHLHYNVSNCWCVSERMISRNLRISKNWAGFERRIKSSFLACFRWL